MIETSRPRSQMGGGRDCGGRGHRARRAMLASGLLRGTGPLAVAISRCRGRIIRLSVPSHRDCPNERLKQPARPTPLGRGPHAADEPLELQCCLQRGPREGRRWSCRFYDGPHAFIWRLAENPSVSIETVKQLAGHVDPRMLGRYAHIRVQARRDAIATLETPISGRELLQNSLQSADGDEPVIN